MNLFEDEFVHLSDICEGKSDEWTYLIFLFERLAFSMEEGDRLVILNEKYKQKQTKIS